MTTVQRIACIAVLLLVALLAGCMKPTPVDSGIEGTADLGPTCPVQRTGDPSCDDKPYHGTLLVATADGSQDIKAFETAADGTFKVGLEPGNYMIRSEGQGPPTCSAEGPITVVAGQYSAVRVHCDSGIR